LNVNFIGSVEITQAFLPLIRQSKGRLISISSMAGEVPLPGFAGYGASKAALISFNGAIRQELSRWGVKVIIIQPGAFKTNILGSREQWNSAQEDILSGLAQEVMVSYGEEYIRSMQQRLVNMSSVSSSDTGPFLEALKHAILSPRPKPFYYPGASAWALPLLYRHSPTSLSDRILSRIFMSSDAQPCRLSSLNKNKNLKKKSIA
uniref:Estradiol 17-beta-dehydrogenase 2-like n=1 Tax=Sinocyclocheilus grahami TaxID=75366 RepID=A0A672QE30_SINGR